MFSRVQQSLSTAGALTGHYGHFLGGEVLELRGAQGSFGYLVRMWWQ